MTDITLKEISINDLELIRSWRNSKEVSKYMYTDNYITSEQQIEWYNRVNLQTNSKYWIIEFQSKPLGLVSLTDISTIFDSCFWAFYLGDTSVRGAGIGSKIEFTILKYVFEELGLNKLRCEVLTTNEKVIAMHEKFGFRREAYYRQHVRKGNIYYDVVGLAILRSEWIQTKDYHYKRIYNK